MSSCTARIWAPWRTLSGWAWPGAWTAWIWERSPAFSAYRGTAWMKEPCRSCAHRERDFGGCRCQAHALTGDPTRTDPACRWAPDHPLLRTLVDAAPTRRPDGSRTQWQP